MQSLPCNRLDAVRALGIVCCAESMDLDCDESRTLTFFILSSVITDKILPEMIFSATSETIHCSCSIASDFYNGTLRMFNGRDSAVTPEWFKKWKTH